MTAFGYAIAYAGLFYSLIGAALGLFVFYSAIYTPGFTDELVYDKDTSATHRSKLIKDYRARQKTAPGWSTETEDEYVRRLMARYETDQERIRRRTVYLVSISLFVAWPIVLLLSVLSQKED
jgi:O-antigen/teichoic acid export membrane protein